MKQFAIDNELITIACADCNISLHDTNAWEPVLRLDSSTGELTQHAICYVCIDDIECLRNGPTWMPKGEHSVVEIRTTTSQLVDVV